MDSLSPGQPRGTARGRPRGYGGRADGEHPIADPGPEWIGRTRQGSRVRPPGRGLVLDRGGWPQGTFGHIRLTSRSRTSDHGRRSTFPARADVTTPWSTAI